MLKVDWLAADLKPHVQRPALAARYEVLKVEPFKDEELYAEYDESGRLFWDEMDFGFVLHYLREPVAGMGVRYTPVREGRAWTIAQIQSIKRRYLRVRLSNTQAAQAIGRIHWQDALLACVLEYAQSQDIYELRIIAARSSAYWWVPDHRLRANRTLDQHRASLIEHYDLLAQRHGFLLKEPEGESTYWERNLRRAAG